MKESLLLYNAFIEFFNIWLQQDDDDKVALKSHLDKLEKAWKTSLLPPHHAKRDKNDRF